MKQVMVVAVAVAAFGVLPAQAQERRSAEEWCRESGSSDDRARACDVREYTLPAGAVRIDAGPNGGVKVIGGSRTDTLVRARVVSTAESQADADALSKQVQVATTGGSVKASGPDTNGQRRRGWHVSYEVWVPQKTDVSASTRNGGISLQNVSGTLGFEAVNGGVSLSRVSGDVKGSTVNGGVSVELTGARWEGAGLDARTTNGGVKVKMPDGYACQLAVSTVNGGVRTDFPLTVQGRVDRRLDVALNGGGPPVRITTTNGGVHLSH
jgi:hypothetical protein